MMFAARTMLCVPSERSAGLRCPGFKIGIVSAAITEA
jgi:hypothetical protein